MSSAELSRFYCSELSRRAGELSAGTASTGAVWLLLEYTHGWGRRAFEESVLPAGVKRFFSDTMARVRNSRLLFVKTDRARRDAQINLFVVRCRERAPFVVRLGLGRYEDVTRYDLEALAAGRDLQGGVLREGPLFLVCTHGRRDKCCAKFGVPLYNALREHGGESVWQSSHVGGDRFAGNLVCFPHGLFYAHADAASGRRVLDAYGAGRLLTEEFRGRACYSHFIQAAEYFVRERAGFDGVEDLRFVSSEPAGEETWRIRFAERAVPRLHESLVARRLSEFRNPITCHDDAPRPVPQYRLESYSAT